MVVEFPRYNCVVKSSSSSDIRGELRNVLIDQRGIIDILLGSAEDPSVPAAQLAHWAEWLERLDDRRDELIRALRGEATEDRKREEERSVRQFVLRALEELESPQKAGFLQEYAWARFGVDLDTRGFGALRRDERRSWNRNPGRRRAYIVPTLDAEGHPLARWMARSDWPLEDRITLEGDGQRLLDLHKILALYKTRLSGEPQDQPGDPLGWLIEKYGRDLLSYEAVADDDAAGREAWLAEVRESAEAEFSVLAPRVASARLAAAVVLAKRPEEEQLWGVSNRQRDADLNARRS
jgi:hypothetical protein